MTASASLPRSARAGLRRWPVIVRWLACCVLWSGGAAGAATPCSEWPAGAGGSPAFVAAVLRNAPAVVQVIVIRGSRDPLEESSGFEFFQPLAGLPLPGSEAALGESLERTFSSGFIIDSAGYVLASAHAVFDAHETWVLAADGRRFRARVVGLDRGTDIALLKVEATGLPVVAVGAQPPICPGSWVAAIGAPFGFEHTVTVGVVSAYPRFLMGSSTPLIQTDAVLNPGSSGGPLFNADGVLVGMNSMIYSASGIYIGVSFALPAERVLRVAAELRASGRLRRGELGIRTQALTPDLARAFGLGSDAGALVVRVEPGSAAEQAGLRAGDVVLSVGRGGPQRQPDIEQRIGSAQPGAELELALWRSQAAESVKVRVAASTGDSPPRERARPAAPESRLGLGLVTGKAIAGLPAGVEVETATGSALLAGLERGDRITAMNGIAVRSVADFDAALESLAQRGVIALLVVRGTLHAYVAVIRENLRGR